MRSTSDLKELKVKEIYSYSFRGIPDGNLKVHYFYIRNWTQ